MSKRRSARELALKILFQVDVGKLPLDDVLEAAHEEVRPPVEDWQYVRDTVPQVVAEQQDLDRLIDELAEGWRVERLANVDKIVLRLALFELIHRPDVAANVVINDAVEVAKKYSTDDSGKFVNGILGSFLRRREIPNEDGDTIKAGTH